MDPTSPEFNQPNNTSSLTHDSLTVSGGITVSISSDYAASIASQTLSALRKARKLQLVLDLDHTLVHATADPRAEYWKREGGRTDVHTILLPWLDGHPTLTNDCTLIKHFLKFRHHLPEFLESIMDKYEVIIYTAGTRMYANKTADAISRHLLNYQISQKEKDNFKPITPYCLDEDDLYALRARVAMMEHEVKVCKNLQNANEQWRRDNDIDNNTFGNPVKEHRKSETADDPDDEHESTKSLKRKRVSFGEEQGISSVLDADKGNDPHRVKESEKLADALLESLENLRKELKNAEARENEALALRMKLFGSRIVSRTDVSDLGRDVKSLSRVFPCGGKMAAIVDDREDVWANADDFSSEKQAGEPPDNLLLTRPFHWQPFLGYEDVNNPSGVDITKQFGNYIPNDDDPQLLWTSDILSRLYHRYYRKDYTVDDDSEYETVPSILRQMRREVLGGNERKTNIVLSGVIPINIQEIAEEKGSFTRPPLLRYVESLGANVRNDVTDETTHVVAARDGTDKVKRARRVRGCSIVNVSWLMECYWSISLRDTSPHSINKTVPSKIQQLATKLETRRNTDDDDDDDNFDLEAEYD
jgi:RNA polymerase II subunit A-like phosphatase